jgi:hypothetical protein
MVALLTTYFIVAYILIPGILFRFPASLFVRLRLFQLTRTQEATFGVAVSLLPFVLALVLVWHAPVARSYPFPQPEGTFAAYKEDYRRVMTLALSADPAKMLEPEGGHQTAYALALNSNEHRQLRFLSWYYLLTMIEGGLFGVLARKYGDWSGWGPYDWFARKIMLPRISEWQLLLTDFNFPKRPKRVVYADVLSGKHLYRGRVEDYFLNLSGELSGILLNKVERFRREQYEEARSRGAVSGSGKDSRAGAGLEVVDPDNFWAKIPGANFYIPAKTIANLNVRFPYDDASLQKFLDRYITDHLNLGMAAQVSIEDGTDEDGVDEDAEPADGPQG